MSYAENGYIIQPGDVIEKRSIAGIRRSTVVRVTKTLAIVRYNEHTERRFPRVFGFGFAPKPRPLWARAAWYVIPGG